MEDTTRVLEKIVTIEDKTYRVRKMNALVGSFVMKQLFGKLIPMLSEGQKLMEAIENAGEEDGSLDDGKAVGIALASLPTILDRISEEDIQTLMQKALNYTDVQLPAGWCQIMTGDYFSYPELEYDLQTCLALTVQCLAFNASGFFGGSGSPLSWMTAALTSQPERKTSTKRPSRQ